MASGHADESAYSPSSLVQDAERAFRLGRLTELLALASSNGRPLTPLDDSKLQMIIGMAHFELGNATESFDRLRRSVQLAQSLDTPEAHFQSVFALFSRESQFFAPEESLPSLSLLRQLAAKTGTPSSLGQLHLVMARIEGIRGHCINARRHAASASSLLRHSGGPVAAVNLVHAGLEMYAGNLTLAVRSARDGLEQAKQNGLAIQAAGSFANLGALMVATGRPEKAHGFLEAALQARTELRLVAFSALDTLAQLAMFEGNLRVAHDFIEESGVVLRGHTLPARSWYDLAHQVTRCSYFEQLGDWDAMIDVADSADPELARRQYKAVRTAILCAKARALARLGRHHEASTALAAAVRTCPRGAVDPLIVLEASKALCATLRGESGNGSIHYDRALAGCRAIGHRYHEWWIGKQRDEFVKPVVTMSPAGATAPAAALDLTHTSMLLNDVATALGAGHSIDLLAHRIAGILQSTSLASRVEVSNESGLEYRPDPVAEVETSAEGACTIRLLGSDRLAIITVRGVDSIEEISLIKSITDLVQMAVARTADTEREDEDLTLWPRAVNHGGDDTIFRSPRMIELVRIAERLAATTLPVLITGETGTGKEVFARLIHEHSAQKRGPFVPFNCSAVTRELVESQLFGHRRGAFTGAIEAFPGVVRTAERGTLFLDEIGDLEPLVQPKLLRFLESGEIQPVGDTKPQRVNVRIVAATNSSLEALTHEGRFRRDLFYRVGVAHLELPPLRERKDEIPAFAALFLTRYAAECGRAGLRLADDLIAALLLYDWPGNIRQLANEIRRVAAMAVDGQVLGAADLAPEITAAWNARPTRSPRTAPAIEVRLDQPLARAIDELERKFIEHALSASRGRVADAAQLLGLSRKGLFLKRRRCGLVGGES